MLTVIFNFELLKTINQDIISTLDVNGGSVAYQMEYSIA
jgi:hypothetical protein